MLVVLTRSPVAAPLKAGLDEEAEAEVVVVYLVGEVPRASGCPSPSAGHGRGAGRRVRCRDSPYRSYPASVPTRHRG